MKKELFWENAKMLYNRFEIIPLMYGSLGLEYVTCQSLNADDVDILIPEAFVNERWDEFKGFLASEGYALTDEHEHTFQKNGVSFSYASIEELESFAEIKLTDIKQLDSSGITFKILSLQQYLKVYHASAKDGYRISVREKKDNDKIELIEKCLNIKQ